MILSFIHYALDRGQQYLTHYKKNKLECGSMPNVMATLTNIGGALC